MNRLTHQTFYFKQISSVLWSFHYINSLSKLFLFFLWICLNHSSKLRFSASRVFVLSLYIGLHRWIIYLVWVWCLWQIHRSVFFNAVDLSARFYDKSNCTVEQIPCMKDWWSTVRIDGCRYSFFFNIIINTFGANSNSKHISSHT